VFPLSEPTEKAKETKNQSRNVSLKSIHEKEIRFSICLL
jgi:hypothetical protein